VGDDDLVATVGGGGGTIERTWVGLMLTPPHLTKELDRN